MPQLYRHKLKLKGTNVNNVMQKVSDSNNLLWYWDLHRKLDI